MKAAIELRYQRQKHSDFFFKLAELKERIEVYNEVFRSKVPKYIKALTLAKKVWFSSVRSIAYFGTTRAKETARRSS